MNFEPSKWTRIVTADPGHSRRYIERFEMMAAAGHDLLGETRTVDAMVPRNARILDAGCGPGRHGGRLEALGHTVVGVDGDPELIEAAQSAHPEATWVVSDLAELDLAARGIEADFDAILCAGNVMGFLAPSTRVGVLDRFRGHLKDDGRAIIGFGAGRGYEFDDFFSDVASAGLAVELALSTWDLRPFTPGDGFLVAICVPA
ncbi:MAG: class I SAM-dependent methyltransferase [Arachnia sp.]